MIISLCGFMGAGKSTIGKFLASHTGYAFIDLDRYIEAKRGCTIADFFAMAGEKKFREEEFRSLQEIIQEYTQKNNHLILALGGGTVMQPPCADLIKTKTLCLYLYCNQKELVKRLKRGAAKRPLLAGKSDRELEEHIMQLMQQRAAIYESCACAIIDTGDWNIRKVIERIFLIASILNKDPD